MGALPGLWLELSLLAEDGSLDCQEPNCHCLESQSENEAGLEETRAGGTNCHPGTELGLQDPSCTCIQYCL